MGFQTSVQNSDAIRLGSCKLEVEDHPGAFVTMTDVGILKGAKLTINYQRVTFLPDNAPEVDVTDQITGAEITATLHEWTLETLEKLGLGTVTETQASPVSGKTLTIGPGAWAKDTFIPITSQPVGVVTKVEEGESELTVSTDYIVAVDANGVTGIVVTKAPATPAKALTITYGYTPAASKSITLGGKGAQPKYIAVQMTNTNAAGKKYRYRLFKVKLSSNFEHTFTADSGGEPAGIPITLTARPDPTLPDDENVIQIYDEQAV